MASLLVRKLDDSIRARLRIRAARHGQSVEAEVREILKSAVAAPDSESNNLGDKIHLRFARLGGFKMPKISRQPVRTPPRFER